MAFESISTDIVQIEEMLLKDMSPRAIAEALGTPEKQKTISRYRDEVFNFKKLGNEQWAEEKQKGHKKRLDEGKAKIVDNYEFLNKLKLRADSLLDFKAGDKYKSSKGNGVLTPGSLAKIYGEAAKIGTVAIKSEQELAGDDPESRKADAIESLSEDEIDARLRKLITITETGSPETP